LQTYLDDHGRAEDEPDIFASVLFQVMRDVTPGMVDRWLWEMSEAGLIDRYEVDGTPFLEVVRWSDFQHPQRPKASQIPPAQSVSTRRVRDDAVTPPSLFADGEGWDGRGDGYGEEGESEGEPPHVYLDCRSVDNPNPLHQRIAALPTLYPQQSEESLPDTPATDRSTPVSPLAAVADLPRRAL